MWNVQSAFTLQDTIWDLEMDPVTGLTNAEFQNAISADDSLGANTGSCGTSPGSALSSAPSGLLTPTIGSTASEVAYSTQAERRIYERRGKIRKSWVYFSESGSEYTTPDGKTRWRCAQCRFPHSTPLTFSHSDFSWKDMKNYAFHCPSLKILIMC